MSSESIPLDSLANDPEAFMSAMGKMLSGRIDREEAAVLLDLIDQSDDHLETADALWAEQLAIMDDVPELAPEAAQRIEQMIEQRIHRADFSGELFRLGTEGVAAVWSALLRPLFSPDRWNRDPSHTGDETHGE